MSLGRWRATALRAEVLRDASDQMSVLLAADRGVMRVLTISRTRGSFSDGQQDLLATARVHLDAAVRRADPAGSQAVRFSPTLRQVALSSAPGMNARAGSNLTRRQQEVLTLVACGLSDAQLGVTGRAAAAAHWIRHAAAPGAARR